MDLWIAVILLLAPLGNVAFAVPDNSQFLSLLPAPPSVSKPKGTDFAVTCLINNNLKGELITDFRWLDPKNRTIDDNYKKINARFSIGKFEDKKLILIINKLSDTDVGFYTCTANYDTRVSSVSTKIELFTPITFLDAPVEQSATIGTNYKVKCKVLADPSPQLTWYRNGEKLVNGQHYTYDSDGLMIQKVQESDDGEYSCEIVVSENGQYQKRDIHLEVTSAPVIKQNLTSELEVIEGEQASIQCSASGKPKPTITWIRGSDGKNLTIGYDGFLFIQKITREDNTEFKCVATNKAGQAERSVKFNVLSKPEVVETRNGTAPVGGNGQIECYVRGNPVPTVIIRKSDTNEISSTVIAVDKMRPDTVKATLNFQKVERTMDGLYECVATNEINSQVSQTIRNLHFTVEFPPTFEKTGIVKDVVTWNTRPVNLTCIAASIPNATITWFFGNGKYPIANDGEHKLFGTGPKSVLQVTPLQKINYGTYRCVAKNLHGEAEHKIELKEAFVPSPLSSVKNEVTTATTVTFSFGDPVSTGNLPVKGYIVQYMEQGFNNIGWDHAINKTWPTGGPYILHDLKPLTEYVFQFAVINDVGRSSWGNSLTIKMPEISSPSEPVISNSPLTNERYVKSPHSTKIDLRWNIPSSNGADIDKYSLKYCLAYEDQRNLEGFTEQRDTCKTQEIQFNSYSSSYVITDLKQDSIYIVYLTAHNNIGYGQASSRYFKTNVNNEKPRVMEDTRLNSAVIIYIVIAILIGLMVIIDVFCFFFGKMGILRILCDKCCGRKKQNDDKLGSENKDLISNGHKRIENEEQAPMIVDGSKKETAIKYDMKKGTSKTGFVGKDSAV